MCSQHKMHLLLVSLVSAQCVPFHFPENAFYKCIQVHRANALIIYPAQNTSVLMKALNCKRKFKPITTERQFHNTGAWHGASAGNKAWLVDWKVPSAIWEVSLHFQRSQKEKNSLLGNLITQLFQLGRSFCNHTGQNTDWELGGGNPKWFVAGLTDFWLSFERGLGEFDLKSILCPFCYLMYRLKYLLYIALLSTKPVFLLLGRTMAML